jgi:predicted nucleotidyltransferase
MRLSDQERHTIKQTVAKWFGTDAQVRLFGSRADDRLRGGDIDLHIVTTRPDAANLDTELAFSVDLKDRIGEQRIDVVLRHRAEPEHPIDRLAKEKGILL